MPDSDSPEAKQIVLPGTLYVVATPIGNLQDISPRAQQVLSQVSLIAAEDTRHTRQLLNGLTITGQLQSYHDFSDETKTRHLLARLESGDSVALVSDAGTPLISDPGYKLVRQARDAGITVLPIPGPCAATAALSVAGLPTDKFLFEGFLPGKTGARQARLQQLRFESRTLVFYESPHRIRVCCEDLHACFGGQRQVCVSREMTKKFEEHFFGCLDACVQWLETGDYSQKGEFVLVVAGANAAEQAATSLEQALAIVRSLRKDISLKRAVALAAEITGVRKNELYKAALADAAPSSE